MTIKFDPVLYEVIRHELTAVSEEMNITMKQTTRSFGAKEASDFSAGLLSPDGAVITQAVQYGMSYLDTLMPHIINKYGDSFKPGEVIVSNDPYGGLSHLPDIGLVMPLFWRGEHVGFGTVVEHHTDIGGRFPGGMGIACAEIYEEGLRLPAVRLYRDGKMDDELRQIIECNVRAPEDVIGDFEAGVAACRRGEQGLCVLLDKYGRETVEFYYKLLRTKTEEALRNELRKIPDGSYRVEEFFDDGAGTKVKIVLTLISKGDEIILDFTGTGPQTRNALNCPPGFIRSLMVQNVFYQFIGDKGLPVNSGLFAPVSAIVPEGTVLNPRFPAAVGSRGQIVLRVYDLLVQALAQAVPGLMPAMSEGGVGQMIFTADKAIYGERAAMMMETYASGMGGRPNGDGVEGIQLPFLVGFRSQSGEAMERELPIVLEGFGFVPDTGGPGKHRGALSVYRRWRFLAEGRVMLRNNRIDSCPKCLAGGRDGTLPKVIKISDGVENEIPLTIMLDIPIKPGDVLMHIQPGAAGWGDPFEREPERVLADVLDEKITPAYAQREYGVLLDAVGHEVDHTRTETLRARLRAQV